MSMLSNANDCLGKVLSFIFLVKLNNKLSKVYNSKTISDFYMKFMCTIDNGLSYRMYNLWPAPNSLDCY